MDAPTAEHIAALKHLVRYIAGARSHGCFFGRGEPDGTGYSDSDLAGRMGMTVRAPLVSYPVSWQSHKQRVVALSACEAAEYSLMSRTMALPGYMLIIWNIHRKAADSRSVYEQVTM